MSTPVNAATDGFFAPLHFPEYRTTIKRNPTNDLIMVPERLGEISGPVFGDRDLGGIDNDMTQANGGEAIGQRIFVHGRVLGWDGKPVPHTLVEAWQANAAGRYRHKNDSWPAPLDPHFNDDADLDQAVGAATLGKFLHQGQICMAVNRIIVQAEVYDEFVEKFTERVRGLTYGDQLDHSTIVGPLINDQQVASVTAKIEKARAEGARELLSGPIEGRVIAPHVFADVTADMEPFREEIFGPVVGIIKADSEERALELANDTEFGLSSAVYTRDLTRGVRFARRIEAGMTHVNDITVNNEAHVMFGGEKNSGLGRFNGQWAIDAFTTEHWVGVAPGDAQFPF